MSNPIQRPDFVPSPRRVRVMFGGEVIAQSEATILVRNERTIPVYYFPPSDVAAGMLKLSDQVKAVEGKGDTTFWDVAAGDKVAKNAAWSFASPTPEAEVIKDYVAFDWPQMEKWFEEDEQVFVHARDPYHRVDVVDSRRSVRVVVGGEDLATSTSTRVLFETGLPVRYYIPREDVRMAVMEPSATVSQCPYKGTAEYFSARIGGAVFKDIVWTYPNPIAECPRIANYLCFFNEHVDDIFVDGKAIEKVASPWSKNS